MTYVNALKYLASLPNTEANVERAHKIRELLSSRDEHTRSIHILGMQGKNSCHRMLSSILFDCGFTVGGFSPSHASEPREAITINGKPVSHETFTNKIELLKNTYASSEEASEPTADEMICLAATLIFEECKCDIAIYEKGIKKSDAANLTDSPILSIVTSMGELSANDIDLTDVFRRGTTETVTSPQHKDVYNAISESCARIGSRLSLSIYSELEITRINLFKTLFSYSGKEYSIRSFSPYQTINAITVIEAANALIRLGMPITQENIFCGIEKSTFPYRCEAISLEPTIILNAIDSPSQIGALASSIAQIAEHIKGDALIAIEDCSEIEKDHVATVFGAYGITLKSIVSISPSLTPARLAKEINGLVSPLISDEEMSSALIIISKKDFATKLSEALKRALTKI